MFMWAHRIVEEQMPDKKTREDQDVRNNKPEGVSDEAWTEAQRNAAQQGISPEDAVAQSKDPMHGLGLNEDNSATVKERK